MGVPGQSDRVGRSRHWRSKCPAWLFFVLFAAGALHIGQRSVRGAEPRDEMERLLERLRVQEAGVDTSRGTYHLTKSSTGRYAAYVQTLPREERPQCSLSNTTTVDFVSDADRAWFRLHLREPDGGWQKVQWCFDGTKWWQLVESDDPAHMQHISATEDPQQGVLCRVFHSTWHLLENGMVMSEWLRFAGARLAGRQVQSETECLVVEVPAGKRDGRSWSRSRYWFSARGQPHLYRYELYRERPETVQQVESFVAIREFRPGLSLPTVAHILTYLRADHPLGNILAEEVELGLDSLSTGIAVGDEDFVLRDVPPKTLVVDTVEGRNYRFGTLLPPEVRDEDVIEAALEARRVAEGQSQSETPTAEFSQTTKCGIYCLLAVCAVSSTQVASARIAELAEADADGNVSMEGIANAAKALGLAATGQEMSLGDLKLARCPSIAFIEPAHFVTVFGFTDQHVVVLDPPTRVRRVPEAFFAKVWGGKVLVMTPASDGG